MVPSLRKQHRRIWTAWAVWLPLAFFTAVAGIPKQLPDPQFNDHQPEALPVVVKSAKDDWLGVQLRTTRLVPRQYQLEITTKKPIMAAAALVYLSSTPDGKPEEGLLIGELGTVGVQRFDLGSSSLQDHTYVFLFDPIKQKVIQTIKL